MGGGTVKHRTLALKPRQEFPRSSGALRHFRAVRRSLQGVTANV